MIKISRESEVNLINVLIDQDVISGKDLLRKNITERYIPMRGMIKNKTLF